MTTASSILPPTEPSLDVTWNTLRPNDVVRLHAHFWGEKAEDAARWLGLGKRLLDQPDSKDAAEQAFRVALKIDPKLEGKIRDIIAKHQPPEPESKPAAPAAGKPDTAQDAASVARPDYWPAGFQPGWDSPIQPHELARKIAGISGAGFYRSADPLAYRGGQRRDARADANRPHLRDFPGWSEADWEPGTEFGDVRTLDDNYRPYPERVRPGVIIGELLGTPIKQYRERGWHRPLFFATRVALQECPELAVELAECYIRSCRDVELGAAVQFLALAYVRADRPAELRRLLVEGRSFKPPRRSTIDAGKRGFIAQFEEANRAYLSPGGAADGGTLRDALTVASICGNQPAAQRAVASLRTLAAREKWDDRKLRDLDSLEAPLHRSTRGLSSSIIGVGAGKSRAALHDAILGLRAPESLVTEYLRRLDGHPPRTLEERLAPLSNEHIVNRIDQTRRAFGRGCDLTADLLLFLLEERRYDGTAMRSNDIMWLGFHAQRSYGEARALPVYVWAQKSFALAPPAPENHFEWDYYAAMECGIWIQRCIEDHDRLQKVPKLWEALRPAVRLAKAMANDPDTQTKCPYTWEHREMMARAAFLFDLHMGKSAHVKPELEEMVRTLPPGYARFRARIALTAHLVREEKRYDEAQAHYEALAQGVEGPNGLTYGMASLQWLAERNNRPDLWDKAVAYAIAAPDTEAARANPQFRAHFRKEWDSIINKPMPLALRAAANGGLR